MGEIVGILLAAGRSRRFGADKLLQTVPDGRTVAEAAVAKLFAACDRTLAVVGRQSSGELVKRLRVSGIEVVEAAHAEHGMGATLAAGVRATPLAAGWVVALADMPATHPASIVRVVEALRSGMSIAAPVYEGRRGQPVGFAAQWFDALTGLAGDSGARGVLDAHADRLHLIDVADPGILFDIDTMDDLARMRHFDAPTTLG